MWQGYLVTAPGGVQVRMRKAGEKHSLTYKRGRGNTREEREIELRLSSSPCCAGHRRPSPNEDSLRCAVGDRTVEIDVYSGKHHGLVVAEVEFDDEQSAREFQSGMAGRRRLARPALQQSAPRSQQLTTFLSRFFRHFRSVSTAVQQNASQATPRRSRLARR